MSIVSVTPSMVQDIVETAAERELFILAKEMERPPYHFPEEPTMGNRLQRATRVVLDGRITPQSDGSYLVEGSEHRQYRVADSCSCPQSQKGRTRWCYHAVAVALYVEWCKRTAPQPPLALPPVTVEERLALGMAHDATALSTHHTPQEDRMTEDDVAYIPEPEQAPVAVAEPPERATTAATPRPLPGPVLLPSLDARTLEQSMQAWSAQRQVVKRFLQQELQEGVDFYRLTIRGRDTKPTLSKAGAEKFLGLFQLQASFAPDLLTWEMLGKPTDHLLYVCTLRTRSGEVVGEGRGSRCLKQDGGDTNKALKMSEKSALIDAVLRTGALSEVFTQDLDDDAQPAATPAKPSSQELRQRIWAWVQDNAPPDARSREQIAAYLQHITGLELHPDNYRRILDTLEDRA